MAADWQLHLHGPVPAAEELVEELEGHVGGAALGDHIKAAHRVGAEGRHPEAIQLYLDGGAGGAAAPGSEAAAAAAAAVASAALVAVDQTTLAPDEEEAYEQAQVGHCGENVMFDGGGSGETEIFLGLLCPPRTPFRGT